MKRVILLVAIVLVGIAGLVVVSDGKANRLEEVNIWYWDDGNYDRIRSYLLQDLNTLSLHEGFDVKMHKFTSDMLPYEEYLKRLSVALSTGECDMTFTRGRDLNSMKTSLLSLEDIKGYSKILDTFKFDNFLFLTHRQKTYGVNKNILDYYEYTYDDDFSYKDYFNLKKLYRDEGNVLVLDKVELRELIDEFTIDKGYLDDLSMVDYVELYDIYTELYRLVNSGLYDYSEIEFDEDYLYIDRLDNADSPFYTEDTRYLSNIFTHQYRHLKNANFVLVSDIRFYTQAVSNWEETAVAISAFSTKKESCKKLVEKLLKDEIQKWIYKQGYTCQTGYGPIEPLYFNEQLSSFSIERKAYIDAEEGDARYMFTSVKIEDLLFREFLYDTILDSIQSHKMLKDYEFINIASEEIMSIQIKLGLK